MLVVLRQDAMAPARITYTAADKKVVVERMHRRRGISTAAQTYWTLLTTCFY